MFDRELPPPFVIGQKYRDRDGEYTAIGVADSQVTIERADGRQIVADAALKARIHRNLVLERTTVDSGPLSASRRRVLREATGRRNQLMEKILQLEQDGADYTGAEIDRSLAAIASEVGYSEEEIAKPLPTTGRTVFETRVIGQRRS